MRESWPHAPPHYFTPHGTYLVTAATLHRKPLFHPGAKLDLLRDTTFELAKNYRAWRFRAAFAPRVGDPTQPRRCYSAATSHVRILGHSPDVRKIVAGAVELCTSKCGETRGRAGGEPVSVVFGFVV